MVGWEGNPGGKVKIAPLRNLVVVELRPEAGNGHRIQVVSKVRSAVRTGTVVAVGPECREVTVGQGVVVNLLVAHQVEDWYLVAEPQILGTV